jgi:drug/metabolite transporter (DMT)-like permease
VAGTVFIILATFFWALDTLIRYPLLNAGLSAIQIVFMEHVILVTGLWCWLALKRQKLWSFTRKDLLSLIVIGGLGSAIGTLAFTEAFSYMNPTLVILLQKLQPVVAISLSAWLLKEKLSTGYVLCVVLAFSGSFMLMYSDIVALLSSSGWHYSSELFTRLTGYGFTFIAVISWGASTVFGKRLALKGYSSGQIMNGRFTVGLVVLLPFLFAAMPYEQAVNLDFTAKILVMVLMSGAVGMLLYYQGLKKVDSKHSALAEMAFPVMAGVINWAVLDATLSPLQILGGVVLVLASFAVHFDLNILLRKFTKRQSVAG